MASLSWSSDSEETLDWEWSFRLSRIKGDQMCLYVYPSNSQWLGMTVLDLRQRLFSTKAKVRGRCLWRAPSS